MNASSPAAAEPLLATPHLTARRGLAGHLPPPLGLWALPAQVGKILALLPTHCTAGILKVTQFLLETGSWLSKWAGCFYELAQHHTLGGVAWAGLEGHGGSLVG